MPDEENVLVCARLDRPDCWIEGSITGRACSDCRAGVMVAPSGQAVIARSPTMKIICLECALKSQQAGEVASVEPAPGAMEEWASSFLKRIYRRQQNAGSN